MKCLFGLGVIIMIMLFFQSSLTSQTNVDIKTAIYSSVWSGESSAAHTSHPGYSVGLDVIIENKGLLLMPGLYFQKTSIVAGGMDWNKPFKNNVGIRNIKLPMQLGFFIIHSKVIDLRLHGGFAINYEMDVDTNNKILDEDLTQIRYGSIIGITAKVLFLTVHTSYESGWNKIFLPVNPSGIMNQSREKIFSIGVGIYL